MSNATAACSVTRLCSDCSELPYVFGVQATTTSLLMGRHVRVQYSYVANEGPHLTFMTNLKAQRYRCAAPPGQRVRVPSQ